MQAKPLVTIAMATYNQQHIVAQAIESVLACGYTNVELLINDDCSTDNTWNIITSYKDDKINAIRNKVNVYSHKNRNLIIERAKGKYIIFVDGDDVLYAHGLDYLVNLMEGFPKCGATYAFIHRENIVYPIKLSPQQFYKAEYFNNSFLGTSLTRGFFTLDALKKIKGFSDKYISSDEHARLHVAMHYEILITDFLAVWWRVSPNQETNKLDFSKNYKEKLEYTKELFNDKNCPLNSFEKEMAITNLNQIIAKTTIKKILSFNFITALKLYKTFGFNFSSISKWKNNKSKIEPFINNDYLHPYSIPYSQNPLSSLYKNLS